MGDTATKLTAGLVAVALITAFGLHATQLGTLATKAGSAGQGLLGTAETGNASGNA
jgi:hypothetical protein